MAAANKTRSALTALFGEYSSLPEFVGVRLDSVHVRGNFGNSLLHIATHRGDVIEAALLLENGADVNAGGEYGNTPLHDAALQGYRAVLLELLAWGADPRMQNDDGETPLQVATALDHSEIASILQQLP